MFLNINLNKNICIEVKIKLIVLFVNNYLNCFKNFDFCDGKPQKKGIPELLNSRKNYKSTI